MSATMPATMPATMSAISHAKVLVMATDGFEQSELLVPRDRLRAAHASVHVATPGGEAIRGWDEADWGESVPADLAIADVDPDSYDALVLPGGQINPDALRTNADALDAIRGFARRGKPVAAICHAPWLLIEAGLVEGRRLTSFASIATDMRNAGAQWVDEAVARDGNLITSRCPDDLDAFVAAIVGAVEGEAREAA